MLVVSWVAAFVACLSYGVATVLQSVGARRAASAAGVSGVLGIFAQLPYLAGLVLDTLGFVGSVVALRQLPLFLVEAIIAASVGVTAVGAALRGEHLARRDWGALGVLVTGLVLLSLSASPAAAAATSRSQDWLILGLVLVPLTIGLLGFKLTGRASVALLSIAAGLGFSGVATSARAMSSDPISLELLTNPLLWAILAYGPLGIALFAVALQRGKATVVAATTFVIQVVVPSTIGLLLFGDGIAQGRTLVAAAGFLCASGGTIALSRCAE